MKHKISVYYLVLSYQSLGLHCIEKIIDLLTKKIPTGKKIFFKALLCWFTQK